MTDDIINNDNIINDDINIITNKKIIYNEIIINDETVINDKTNITQEINTITDMNTYIDDKLLKYINIKHLNKNNIKTKTILVLSGGGIKGIAHIGALQSLKKHNILDNINVIAGTSIGALIGFLYNIGYTPDELYDFILIFDFSKLNNFAPLQIFNNFGMDDGNKFELVIKEMMISKNIDIDITFIELYKKTNITLITTTSCINDKEVYYFSYKTKPNMKILIALRMAISIPIYFVPVIYENKMYVDGCCSNNYPINLFKNELNNVIGIYVTEHSDYTDKINNIEEFLINLIYTLSYSIKLNEIKDYDKSTIIINLPCISPMNLSVDNKIKENIYNIGIDSTDKFIKINNLSNNLEKN